MTDGILWSFQTHRGGRRCSGRGHHLGFRYFFWDGSLPASPTLTRRVQGAGRYRGPCHHPASSPGRSDRRTEPLPPRQPPPSPLAPCLRGRAAETDAAGASQPVMRQIHQAAAAEGTLKMLDPTLITCQPERPNAAQKLWNTRAISYYF